MNACRKKSPKLICCGKVIKLKSWDEIKFESVKVEMMTLEQLKVFSMLQLLSFSFGSFGRH